MAAARTLNIVAALLVGFLLAVPHVAFAQTSSIWDTVDTNALNQQAMQLYNQGRYSEATPLAQHSLAILKNTQGPDHPNVAVSTRNLATLYLMQGRYADAEPLYKRSLAIFQKSLGPDHPEVATTLNSLGDLSINEGRYADAEAFYSRSLAIREKALGPGHPDFAATLSALGSLFRVEGRYADAQALLKRSLAIREKVFGPDHPAVAASLSELAILYSDMGRYTEAEPYDKRTLAIRENAFGRDHPAVAESLNNLAALYERQRNYADAEPLFKRSLTMYEKALGFDNRHVALSLNNLAILYGNQGRYADAEPLYQRSLAIREKTLGPHHPDVAHSLAALAEQYTKQGRYVDAEPLFRRSLEIQAKTLGQDHPDYARTLNSLANLYTSEGHYADADSLYKQSLVIGEKVLGPDHPDIANWLNNYAALYMREGLYADAERLDKQVLALRKKTLGSNHPAIAESINNLATLYSLLGRYNDALPLVREATQMGFEVKWVSLAVLTGAVDNAIIERSDALDEGFQVVQRTTSSAASNAINQLFVRFAAGNDQLAELVRKYEDLSSENERLDKLIVEAVSKEPFKRDATTEQQIRDRLQAITSEREQIRTSLKQRFPEFAALFNPAPLSIRETQALLADDEALIIFDFDEHSYGGVITRSTAYGGALNITARDLEAQVKTLRASLDAAFDVGASYRLYQSIFGSLADEVASKKRLSIIMNGALTSLPLQLLVTKDPTGKKLKDVDWLVRSRAITLLPSVASLKVLRNRTGLSPAPKPMIAFADPVFSKTARMEARQQLATRGMTGFVSGTQIDIARLAEDLQQLPSTRTEVQAIAKTLQVNPSDIKLRLDATVTAVKEAKLDQYRVVYFATHGLVAGDLRKFANDKVEPALALSIPDKPTDIDNGLLSASEVAQLKLNADWVVATALLALSGVARERAT